MNIFLGMWYANEGPPAMFMYPQLISMPIYVLKYPLNHATRETQVNPKLMGPLNFITSIKLLL